MPEQHRWGATLLPAPVTPCSSGPVVLGATMCSQVEGRFVGGPWGGVNDHGGLLHFSAESAGSHNPPLSSIPICPFFASSL